MPDPLLRQLFSSLMNGPPIYIPSGIDGHVHTKLCHHASGEMEEYVRCAIDKGLQEICFLEHLEAGVNYFETTWLTEDDFDSYFLEGRRLQQIFKESIKVSLGVEVGYSPEHKEELLYRLGKRNWDSIGVSYHFMPNPNGDHDLNLVSRKERNTKAVAQAGCQRVLDQYFQVLTEAVETLPGTVLCHLDAVLRFQPGVTIDTTCLPQILPLLHAVKNKGMALEINTSGFPIRGEQFPAGFILREAAAMGIPFQAGSDAHKPEDVGRAFQQLQGLS